MWENRLTSSGGPFSFAKEALRLLERVQGMREKGQRMGNPSEKLDISLLELAGNGFFGLGVL